jgi:mycofactocin precursor
MVAVFATTSQRVAHARHWRCTLGSMQSPTTTTAPVVAAESSVDDAVAIDMPVIESELLIEEISIDGMCGVY